MASEPATSRRSRQTAYLFNLAAGHPRPVGDLVVVRLVNFIGLVVGRQHVSIWLSHNRLATNGVTRLSAVVAVTSGTSSSFENWAANFLWHVDIVEPQGETSRGS